MEVALYLVGAYDPDLFGQMRIERGRDARNRQPVFNLEVRDLPERVDTGVGPAGASDVDLLAGNSADRLLDLSLNGAAAGKTLPA